MTTISSGQLDALKEMIGVGVGKAAGMLNEMLESHIELNVPSLSILKLNDFMSNDFLTTFGEGKLASVSLGFQGSFSGNSILVFPEESATKLVAALTGEEPDSDSMDDVTAGTLNELGNIVINGVMGSISNYLTTQIDYALPTYLEGEISELLKLEDLSKDTTIMLVETTFMVQNLQVSGSIFIVFEFGSLGDILLEINKLYSN